jgi:hypothetical protein
MLTREENATSQKNQALWEMRREACERFIFTAKECARLLGRNRRGDAFLEAAAAIEELRDLYVQIELAAPNNGDILPIARSLIEHLRELNSVTSDYGRAVDPSDAQTFWTRMQDEEGDLNATMRRMQAAVRVELHRKR